MEVESRTEGPGSLSAVEEIKTKVPTEVSSTHPLEHRWSLWFDNPQQRGKGGGGWGTSLRTIYTFGTVEEFWW